MLFIFFPNYLGDPISDCALNRGTSVTFSCQPLILAVSRANAGWSIFWKFTLAFSSLLQEFQFAFFRKLNSLAYLLNLDVYIWIEFAWYVLLEIELGKSVIPWSFHDRCKIHDRFKNVFLKLLLVSRPSNLISNYLEFRWFFISFFSLHSIPFYLFHSIPFFICVPFHLLYLLGLLFHLCHLLV